MVREPRQVAEEARKCPKKIQLSQCIKPIRKRIEQCRTFSAMESTCASCQIVGKGYHTDEQVVGYYNTGDRMKVWGKNGAFWGGFWGFYSVLHFL
jgi:hypothetical protein